VPQFALYRNANLRSGRVFPLLVDVQAELLSGLQTRVVVPLARAAAPDRFPMTYLTPTVAFEGHSYVLMTPQLAGIARAELGPHVGSLADQQNVISAAVDFLTRGF
jgi:toxin CcdB